MHRRLSNRIRPRRFFRLATVMWCPVIPVGIATAASFAALRKAGLDEVTWHVGHSIVLDCATTILRTGGCLGTKGRLAGVLRDRHSHLNGPSPWRIVFGVLNALKGKLRLT